MAATGHGDEPIIEARGLGKRYDIVRDPRKSDWIINDVVRTVGDVARLPRSCSLLPRSAACGCRQIARARQLQAADRCAGRR